MLSRLCLSFSRFGALAFASSFDTQPPMRLSAFARLHQEIAADALGTTEGSCRVPLRTERGRDHRQGKLLPRVTRSFTAPKQRSGN